MLRFIDNDDLYIEWTKRYPEGFVVNSFRTPAPKYLMLHKAKCYTITELKGNAVTFTGEYSKTCSHDLDELTNWAKEEIGGELRRCQKCFK